MSETKKIVGRIEDDRRKIQGDLKKLSDHFEHLSKVVQENKDRLGYLRCKANMRIVNAMIRGLSTLSHGLILQEAQAAEEDRERAASEARIKEAKVAKEKRAAKKASKASRSKVVKTKKVVESLENQ